MIRDLRKFSRQTNARLLIGFIIILFLVGDGLIYLFYGQQAALLGLLCLLAGIIPLGLIVVILWGLEQLVRKSNEE
jgi:hypothetical protein